MTKIVGLAGMTHGQLAEDIRQGGKFVMFEYCFSIGIATFKRGTNIYWIPPGKSGMAKGLPFTLLTLVVGWWGIPWGFIYTPMALATNLGGGKNVTRAVLNDLNAQAERDATATQVQAAG